MTRKRALVLGDMPGDGLARLQRRCEVTVEPAGVGSQRELARRVRGVHGLLTLLTQPVGEAVLASADRLEIVANCAVGVDNIDLAAARRHGVIVTHTPNVLTDDTADLTWALILAVLRRVVVGDRLVRRGEFAGWKPQLLLGTSLREVTLGVVGAGRIGQAVLERARAFGTRTVYASRSRLEPARERRLRTERRSLEELLAASDVVSLHLPLNERTRHLIDESALRAMRPGSVLINTARGPLVDEGALVRALEDGHLAGAGLDVYEQEPRVHPGLAALDGVVLLPHIGSATRATRVRMADCCFDDLIAVLVRGEVPERAVVGGRSAAPPAG